MPAAWYRTTALACLSAASLFAAQQADGQQPVFRTGVDLTVVDITVRDREGQLLTDLRQGDFQVSEKNRPIPIEQFSVDRQPITAALMVQTMGDLPAHREWAERLVDALGDGDRLRIGSYGAEVAVSPHLTADRQVLRRILDEEMWYGLPIPVATAVYRGALALPSEAARSAVVLIGVDDGDGDRDFCGRAQPCVSMAAARRLITERGVVVYAIVTGLGSAIGTAHPPRDYWSGPPNVSTKGDGSPRALAKQTGGYVLTRTLQKASWPSMAEAVLEQLRVRYVLGVAPHTSGAIDGMTIRVSRPGATVRVQKSRPARRQP